MGYLLLTAPCRGMYLVLLHCPSSTLFNSIQHYVLSCSVKNIPLPIMLFEHYTPALIEHSTSRYLYSILLPILSIQAELHCSTQPLFDPILARYKLHSLQHPYLLSAFNRSTACYLYPLPLADSSATDEIALVLYTASGSLLQKEYIPWRSAKPRRVSAV
jgi:hypothetical protein